MHEVRSTMYDARCLNSILRIEERNWNWTYYLIIGRTLFASIRTSCIGPRTSKSEVECESG